MAKQWMADVQLTTCARSAIVGALLLALSCVALAGEALQDGPYVVDAAAEGRWMARWIEGDAQVRERAVSRGDSITVAAVGMLPAFDVKLREPEGLAAEQIRLRSRTKAFVLADTHGEYEIAVLLLQRHRVIDAALRWTFGKGHLAILGDVFDRGPNHTELLWLFYKLEAEAARAGGGLHLALGNHETMVLRGDERYLNAKYPRVAAVLGAPRYAALWNEQTLLGRWLRSKPAVFRLGDYLCLHGGISREVVERGLTIADMNRIVRESLGSDEARSGTQAELVMGRAGPLWYRGYFREIVQESGFTPAEPADIELIRKAYGVRGILVGHTIVPTVTSLFDGQVIAVQVYPRRDEQTGAPVMEGVLIERGRFFRARIDGGKEPLL